MLKFCVLPLLHSILVLKYLKKPSFFGLQSENYTTKWLSFHCQIGLHLQFAFQFAKNWWFLSRNFKCICFPACMHTTYKQQQNFIQFATFLGGIICTLQLHFLDNSSKILNFWMNGVNFKVTLIENFQFRLFLYCSIRWIKWNQKLKVKTKNQNILCWSSK